VAFPVTAAPEDMAKRWPPLASSPRAIGSGLPPWGPASLALAILDHHPLTFAGNLAGVCERHSSTTHLRAVGPMARRWKPRRTASTMIVRRAEWEPANQAWGCAWHPC